MGVFTILERAKVTPGAAAIAGFVSGEVDRFWDALGSMLGKDSMPLQAAIVAAGVVADHHPSTPEEIARIIRTLSIAAKVPPAPITWCLTRIIEFSFIMVDYIDIFTFLDMLPAAAALLGVGHEDLLVFGPETSPLAIVNGKALHGKPEDRINTDRDRALKLCRDMGPAGWGFVKAIPEDIPAPDDRYWVRQGWVVRAGRWLVLTVGGRRHRSSPKITREVRAWIDALASIPDRSTLARFRREGIIACERGFPVLTPFGWLILQEIMDSE